jgi:hypothetical protein
VFAVLIGFFVWKKRPDAIGIIWLCGLALAMRCYFEPVMTPYYLAPPLIVALAVAASMGRLRFGIATVFALADTVFSYYRFSPWLWWLPVAAMLTVVLACGYPGRDHLVGRPTGSGDSRGTWIWRVTTGGSFESRACLPIKSSPEPRRRPALRSASREYKALTLALVVRFEFSTPLLPGSIWSDHISLVAPEPGHSPATGPH